MNDLHDTLTDHLYRTADKATPWPQPEAITDGAERVRFTSTSQREPQHLARRGLLVTAATLIVLGGIGAVALIDNGPSTGRVAGNPDPSIEPPQTASAATATSSDPTAGDAANTREEVPNAIPTELAWSPHVDPVEPFPSPDRFAPPDFADELAHAIDIIGLRIGDRCDAGNPDWTSDSFLEVGLVSVAGENANGDCVVIGWAYGPSHPPVVFDFELPVDEHGYIHQPVFDEQGRLIGFFKGGPPS